MTSGRVRNTCGPIESDSDSERVLEGGDHPAVSKPVSERSGCSISGAHRDSKRF